jgi:hypothetical protein
MTTPEFIHSIKQILIDKCYREFCKEVNNDETTISREYKDATIEHIRDLGIWLRIFDKVHKLLKYYTIIKKTNEINIAPHQMVHLFMVETTFHDFINDFIFVDQESFDKNM